MTNQNITFIAKRWILTTNDYLLKTRRHYSERRRWYGCSKDLSQLINKYAFIFSEAFRKPWCYAEYSVGTCTKAFQQICI